MPVRLWREGILSSERVDSLDAPAEVFYRRLMSKADDHGLFDARPSILRASLYPLRVDRVREADISRWIAACEKAGLIALYQHDGKPYLQMLDTRWTARSDGSSWEDWSDLMETRTYTLNLYYVEKLSDPDEPYFTLTETSGMERHGYPLVKEVPVTVELPDMHGLMQQRLQSLDVMEKEARARFAREIKEICDRRNSLLAIENSAEVAT